jgi:hypothetical protein
MRHEQNGLALLRTRDNELAGYARHGACWEISPQFVLGRLHEESLFKKMRSLFSSSSAQGI